MLLFHTIFKTKNTNQSEEIYFQPSVIGASLIQLKQKKFILQAFVKINDYRRKE